MKYSGMKIFLHGGTSNCHILPYLSTTRVCCVCVHVHAYVHVCMPFACGHCFVGDCKCMCVGKYCKMCDLRALCKSPNIIV